MQGHDMAAAALAKAPQASLGFLEFAQLIGALHHLEVIRAPEREGIDRSSGPGPAGAAMAKAHRDRLALKLDPDRPAEALSRDAFCHAVPPSQVLIEAGSSSSKLTVNDDLAGRGDFAAPAC